MCGLFGAISPRWDKSIIRSLAVCNRDRGTDSLGFFDSSGRMLKGAGDPMGVLCQENISNWLQNSDKGTEDLEPSWFIAGHTRLGTRGKANRKNAHPFRYGDIIGSHNGVVDAPQTYRVDSMYLFDKLNEAKGDYNTAFADISGYWGLSWYDGEAFYLQVHRGELHLAEVDGVYYYSSDDEHLIASIGYQIEVYKIKEGETWKFSYIDGKIVSEEVEKLVVTAIRYPKYTNQYSEYYDSGYYDSKTKKWIKDADTTTSYDYTTQEKPVTHDWDESWRVAWSEYCTESEHARVGP